MGTDVLIAADVGRSVLRAAESTVRRLERRWSRFLEDSTLSRLNAAAGPAVVDDDTYVAVDLAVQAWRWTGGLFDPTVLDAVVAAGYDRSFRPGFARRGIAEPSPGCGGIVLDPSLRSIRLPDGVRLDLGGLGKGLAADLTVAGLARAGATSALVDVGGDVAVVGEADIEVEDPFGGPHLASFVLVGGGIATSSTQRRRWADGHHLIDPRTGAPTESGVVAATVVAGSAAWAEVLAKVAVVAGVDRAAPLLAGAGATAVLTLDSGELVTVGVDAPSPSATDDDCLGGEAA